MSIGATQSRSCTYSSVFYGIVKLGLVFLLNADHAGFGIGLKGAAQFSEYFLDGVEGFGVWELVADGDNATHSSLSCRFRGVDLVGFFGEHAVSGFCQRVNS